MKLEVGDIIEVQGFVMLKGIDKPLKVKKIDSISYWFTKPNGDKIITRHIISDVDRWINNSNDLNQITIKK